jgi:hypothetical protein
MPTAVTPTVPQAAAPNATAGAAIVLHPGSVISAQVVQILGNDQVRIAIGGQPIDVLSQVPLQAGQALRLQVLQTASGVSLALVDPQGASPGQNLPSATSITLAPDAAAVITAPATPGADGTNNQLTPLESLAVSLTAQTAATQQASLAPLFANLGVAAGLPGLPPQVQQAISQVLAQQTNLDQNLSGADIQQAFKTSGLFLEASLASGSTLPATSTPDLKAALILLRQALTTSLADATASDSAGQARPSSAAAQTALPNAVQQASASAEIVGPALAAEGKAETSATQQPTTLALALSSQGQSDLLPGVVAVVDELETPVTASLTLWTELAAPTASPPAATKSTAPAVAQELSDLAAAARNVLSATTPTTDVAARAAASSAALNLLQEVLQAAGPLAGGNPLKSFFQNDELLSLIPAATGTRTTATADATRTNLPPPPVNGALPAAQPVAPATLIVHVTVEDVLQHLLAGTDGAIARQTLLQIASLPGQADQAAAPRYDASAPRWNFEIPFATPHGTAVAQFEISRDGGGNAVEPAKRIWRARFSLDVEPAGPVHALVSLSGERTSVRMWAERPATASRLRAGVSQLSQALSRAELQPGDIVVRDGAPIQPPAARAGHFLDRAL